MAANELNSFVYKFKNLWRTGQDATLNVKCEAGKARVELSVGLGHPLDLPPPPQHVHRDVRGDNSRDRRRNRRAAERLNEGLKETESGFGDKTKEENEATNNVDKSEKTVENVTTILDKDEKSGITGDESFTENDSDNAQGACQKDAEEATSDNESNEPCDKCTKVFEFYKDLQYSMCDKCILLIAEKEDIKLLNRYQCEVCNRKFKTKTLFEEHRDCFRFGSSSLAFVCESCSKIWKDEDQFEKHMEQKHIIHTCVRCKAKMQGKENLDEHFRTKHRAF